MIPQPAGQGPHQPGVGERQGGQPGSAKSPDQQEQPRRGGRSKAKPGLGVHVPSQARESTHRSGAMRATRIRLSPLITTQGQKVRPRVRNSRMLCQAQPYLSKRATTLHHTQTRHKSPGLSLNRAPGPKGRRGCGEAPGEAGLSEQCCWAY